MSGTLEMNLSTERHKGYSMKIILILIFTALLFFPAAVVTANSPAADTDNKIDGTVTIGSSDNRIVISVTNPSAESPIETAKLEIVKNGRWITNIRVQADKTGPIAPKSTRRFTVVFDISTQAPEDTIDRVLLRIIAQGALVDHPEQEIAVKIARVAKPLVAAYPLKPDAPDKFPVEEAARYCALDVSKINEYDKIVVFITPGRILSKSNPEEFRLRIKNPNGKVVSRRELINTEPGTEERAIDLKLLGPDSPGRFAVVLELWNSDLLPKDPEKRWYIPGKYTVETIRLSPSAGTGSLGQGQGYREEGELQEEGGFEVGEGRIHFTGFVTEPVSNRSLPRTNLRWEGGTNIENLKVDIETGDVALKISSWWRNTKRRGDGTSGPGDKLSRGNTHLTMVFPQSIRPGKVIQKFDGKGSFAYPKEPVAEVEIEWKTEGDKHTGYTPVFLRPVPCRGRPSRKIPPEGWGGRTVIDQTLDVPAAIVNKTWNPAHGRKCVFRVGVCEKYKPFGVPSRTLPWHLHDPDTLWLFPVKFTLSSGVEFYGYGIYRNMPGRYDGPEPGAPPWGKPGSGPGTDVGPEEEAGLPDPDEGARGIPVDPGTLDTNRTDVSLLIREWIAVAEPPENATEGANLRYDKWGRVIGTAADGGIITQTQKPTYALATPEETVWSIRKKLDSVNHCTVEEYVMAKLENRSLEHCRGRYKAPEAVTVENLTGLSLSSAKKKLAGVGLKTRLVAGKPASSKRDEGTVASQDPGPGTKLKPGESVKLEVYGPYNPNVAVPDVAGLEVKEARTKLEEKGLKARLVAFGPAPSNDLALKVKEVDPKAGSNVAPGTEVTVKVYGKYSPPGVSVPGVVGLSLSKAKTSLSRAGFEIKLRAGSKPSSREQEGTVERQRPDPGTKTKTGSEVFIYIYGPFVETIAVPNLVGIKLADAKRILQNIGLELQPTLLGPAPEPGKAGQVVEQQPSATTQIEAGSSVQVKVYGNYVAPGVTVPDIRGMTLQQAKNALSSTNLKIQPSLIGAAPEASQSRKVSSQQPVGGTKVPPGSIVQVKVWGNYAAPGTSIPDVRGMTLSEAKNTLQNVGLAINPSLLGPAPTKEKALRVNSQEPAAGQKVNPGSEVKVYVFSKYAPSSEIDTDGTSGGSSDCSQVAGVWKFSNGWTVSLCPKSMSVSPTVNKLARAVAWQGNRIRNAGAWYCSIKNNKAQVHLYWVGGEMRTNLTLTGNRLEGKREGGGPISATKLSSQPDTRVSDGLNSDCDLVGRFGKRSEYQFEFTTRDGVNYVGRVIYVNQSSIYWKRYNYRPGITLLKLKRLYPGDYGGSYYTGQIYSPILRSWKKQGLAIVNCGKLLLADSFDDHISATYERVH